MEIPSIKKLIYRIDNRLISNTSNYLLLSISFLVNRVNHFAFS